MDSLLKILKLLSDKNRLRILMLLKHKKMCVCELASILGIKQPSVSRHIKKLAKAGLICGEQNGFWTDYRLDLDKCCSKKITDFVFCGIKKDKLIISDMGKANRINRVKLCCQK